MFVTSLIKPLVLGRAPRTNRKLRKRVTRAVHMVAVLGKRRASSANDPVAKLVREHSEEEMIQVRIQGDVFFRSLQVVAHRRYRTNPTPAAAAATITSRSSASSSTTTTSTE